MASPGYCYVVTGPVHGHIQPLVAFTQKHALRGWLQRQSPAMTGTYEVWRLTNGTWNNRLPVLMDAEEVISSST